MKHRPRLSAHVLPRIYAAGQSSYVVLYDTEALRSHPVSRRAWSCISAMDGTRDVEGLTAFLKARGTEASAEEIAGFIAELESQCLVEEGVGALRASVTEESSSDLERRLEPLPRYALECDGAGSCCRFYPSIAFSPHDVAKARAHCPDVEDSGQDERRVFVPLIGVESPMRAVALRDGRCTYLEADGACLIHKQAGAAAKPIGCNLYPSRFVDAGQSVRVLPHLECACVFRSAAAPAATDPIPQTVRDLPLGAAVERLESPVILTATLGASLAEVQVVFDALSELSCADCVGAFLQIARQLNASLSAEAMAATVQNAEGAKAFELQLFEAALDSLERRVLPLTREEWRSPKDLVLVTANALLMAIDVLKQGLAELLEGPGVFAADEAFYFRVQMFGLGLCARSGTRSSRVLAFDRAFRLLLGRALGVVAVLAELGDPAFKCPLSLVEAAMRGYGLGVYVRELEPAIEAAYAAQDGPTAS
jgi:lysine-N-methylase